MARIVNYNHNHSFIVLATVSTIINYDCKTFSQVEMTFKDKLKFFRLPKDNLFYNNSTRPQLLKIFLQVSLL
jgi:hypothetical protein